METSSPLQSLHPLFLVISQNVNASVKRLIEFLITEISPKYAEIKNNTDNAAFCLEFTELAVAIGTYFSIFIFEVCLLLYQDIVAYYTHYIGDILLLMNY